MTDKEEIETQIEELRDDIRQIKEVLNIIIGMLSEEDIEEEEIISPVTMKPDIDLSMLN